MPPFDNCEDAVKPSRVATAQTLQKVLGEGAQRQVERRLRLIGPFGLELVPS